MQHNDDIWKCFYNIPLTHNADLTSTNANGIASFQLLPLPIKVVRAQTVPAYNFFITFHAGGRGWGGGGTRFGDKAHLRPSVFRRCRYFYRNLSLKLLATKAATLVKFRSNKRTQYNTTRSISRLLYLMSFAA